MASAAVGNNPSGREPRSPPLIVATQRRRTALALAAALSLLVAATTYLVVDQWKQVWADAHRNTLHVATALETSATALLQQSAGTLARVANRLGQQQRSDDQATLSAIREAAPYESVSAYLGVRSAASGELTLVDRAGELVDRPVTQSLADEAANASDKFELHPMIQLAADPAWYVPLTLGVRRGGTGLDTVIALVPVQRLLAATDSLRVLPDGWLEVVTTDGVRLFNYSRDKDTLEPNPPHLGAQLLQQNLTMSSFEASGESDGIRYVVGCSLSRSLPFFAAASVPVSLVYLTWLRQASAAGIVLLLGLIGIVIFAVRLRGALVKQQLYASEQEYLHTHDALTGLPNREAFMRMLGEAITESQPFAVLLLDLNRFQYINDTLGHRAGDEALTEIGKRLSVHLRGQDASVARLGGDELVVFVRRTDIAADLDNLCASLQAVIGRTLTLGAVELSVTASMGAVLYPDDATTPVELLRCADIALYAAKGDLHPYVRYAPALDNFTADTLALKSDLGRALQEGELSVVYQPKVRLSDGVWIGLEALSRWRHPISGNIPPSRFIPVAETSELIHPFTQYVLRNAALQARRWLAAGHPMPVSVNISANNLLDHNFVDRLRALLEETGLPAELLELEVTETAVLRHPDRTLKRLQDIRDLGVKLSIDDFGTGYASLAYLKQLPVDALKIDKSFVMNLGTDAADQRIVKGSIQLAQSFGMTVVAEGVESEPAAERLREYGCLYAQGFYFSRPLEADQIEGFLAERAGGSLAKVTARPV
ncbi:MAG TPA: bifunctional diguanylate cyclase/phosphodiesterase [Steroidobacteraceae bacterium]|nr:bifunctional diguanylate cyclase/phosphodiesterase [Steroidobacteraceae bacterium]